MRRNTAAALLMTAGVLFLLAALVLTGYNLWDEKNAAQTSGQALEQLLEVIPSQLPQTEEGGEESPEETDELAQTPILPLPSAGEVEIPDHILNPEMELPEQSVNGESYIGVLEIPALGLRLPIISQWSDRALKSAPCRYAGSPYTEDLIIAGHNYRSHFADLKSLPEDSPVYFTDLDGNRFPYRVVLIETLASTDVEEMESGDWALTLFTCTSGGQHRVAVRCRTAGP